MNTFELPPAIADLVAARNSLRRHYLEALRRRGIEVELKFTLDGNLVGDLGEAIAVELFGIQLVETKSTKGIDGYAPDRKTTVQIKATGTGRGPAFRQSETRADHLLFFDLDFERASGTVVYNGPEHLAVTLLPKVFAGQRSLSRKQICDADTKVKNGERLARVAPYLFQGNEWQSGLRPGSPGAGLKLPRAIG
jgi:hypothetical protein